MRTFALALTLMCICGLAACGDSADDTAVLGAQVTTTTTEVTSTTTDTPSGADQTTTTQATATTQTTATSAATTTTEATSTTQGTTTTTQATTETTATATSTTTTTSPDEAVFEEMTVLLASMEDDRAALENHLDDLRRAMGRLSPQDLLAWRTNLQSLIDPLGPGHAQLVEQMNQLEGLVEPLGPGHAQLKGIVTRLVSTNDSVGLELTAINSVTDAQQAMAAMDLAIEGSKYLANVITELGDVCCR